jgi:hypothetical protein
MNILVVTVGGSCEPIVNAIKNRKPDFVYFICSSGNRGSHITVSGEGKPCKERDKSPMPNIVSQTKLTTGQYKVWLVDDPDSLIHCYEHLVKMVDDIKNCFSKMPLNITANYTGGTKTMSVALSLMALNQENWDLELNKGPRTDLVKVKTGDVPILINKWEIFVEHQLKTVKQFISNFQYDQALKLIMDLLKLPISNNHQNMLIKAAGICKAFDAWDRFSHEKALSSIEPYAGMFNTHFVTLKKILNKTSNTGYEKVVDLVNNAQRRASQCRFDDAVARLYRALEMLAQIRLKTAYENDTSEISLEKLPEQLRKEYEKYTRDQGKIILGLREDYHLLAKLDDEIGKDFVKKEKQILDGLKIRNCSILAHSETPVTEEDYQKVSNTFVSFINEALSRCGLEAKVPQLPVDILDRITELEDIRK